VSGDAVQLGGELVAWHGVHGHKCSFGRGGRCGRWPVTLEDATGHDQVVGRFVPSNAAWTFEGVPLPGDHPAARAG